MAALTQRVHDLVADVKEVRDAARADHHRLRAVEDAVIKMIEAQRIARHSEETQYRRLEVRIGWAGVLIALGMLGIAAAVALHSH